MLGAITWDQAPVVPSNMVAREFLVAARGALTLVTVITL